MRSLAMGSCRQFSFPQVPDRAVSAQRMLVCGDFLRSALLRGGAAVLPSVWGLTLAPRGVRADFGDGFCPAGDL
jgi:hypothetical protein